MKEQFDQVARDYVRSNNMKPTACRIGVFDLLCKIWRVITRRKRRVECLYLPARIVRRPEPNIYSQFFLMQLGQPVTWDNPDIRIMKNGAVQYSYDLRPATDYDLEITLHNSSAVVPALHTRVEIRWVEFGAGNQIIHPIETLALNIPTFPQTAAATTRWTTPASPGHYCIEVELFHSDDALSANNRGWNNTVVKEAASPLEFPLRIFNQKRRERRRLTDPSMRKIARGLDALMHDVGDRETPVNYVEVTLDSYVFRNDPPDKFDPRAAFNSRPPFAPATVEPRSFSFKEGETFRDVTVRVEVPDDFSPDRIEPLNITAWQGGSPAGGVTAYVRRKAVN